jgi:hypothetical protein
MRTIKWVFEQRECNADLGLAHHDWNNLSGLSRVDPTVGTDAIGRCVVPDLR